MNTVDAIKHFFLSAGASWVLWLLGALSVGSVGVAVERWLTFRRKEGDLRALAEGLARRLEARQLAEAAEELSRSDAVAASVAAAGLRLSHLGPAAVDKAMSSALALEKSQLEKRLAYLGTLGNNAPFIGLFGTVIGVIEAFEELGHGALGHGGGQAASQTVMSGIAEALVATAIGIAVALPAVAAHNYLQRRLATLLSGSEVLSNLLLAYLCGTPQLPDGGGGNERSVDAPGGAPPLAGLVKASLQGRV